MRIGVVHPVCGSGYKRPMCETGSESLYAAQSDWQALASPGTEVILAALDGGPGIILRGEDENDARTYILDQVERLAQTVDAIVIGCFCDPCLHQARDLVQIPVIGVGEASMTYASQIAEKFIIATPVDLNYMSELVERAGMTRKVTSVRYIDTPISEWNSKRDEVLSKIADATRDAITHEGVETVVLGCCALAGFEREVENMVGIPVFNPKLAAMSLAESIISMRSRELAAV